MQGNLTSEYIPVPRFLQPFRFILQDYLQDESKSLRDESKSLQESCKLFDSNAGKGGQRRKGADFRSSKHVLAFALAFLASLKTRAGTLLCSKRSAPDLATKEKKTKTLNS